MKSKKITLLIFLFALLFTFNGVWAQEGDFSFLENADTQISSTGSVAATEATASGTSDDAASSATVSEEPATNSEFPWQGRVTASMLNVRNQPWGNILKSISRDTTVTVTATATNDSQWLMVTFSGGSGCVHGAYITKTGNAVPSAATENSSGSEFPFEGTVTASSLNARQNPWGTKVTTFSRGQNVTVTARSTEDEKWYAVTHSSGTVYCHSSYISKGGSDGSSPSGTPSSVPSSGNLSQDILSSMASMESNRLTYPSPCGKTRNGVYYPGWLGCAFAVSTALNMAGVDSYSLGVNDLSNQLMRQPDPGFVKVPASSRAAGDVVIWNPSHIGVIKGNGRCYSNSSSNGYVREHSDTYQEIRFVLRAPA